MQISLIKPDLERFVREEVDAGRYPSTQAVIEAAIANLRDNPAEDLDAETIAAINRAEEQIDRGEGIDFDEFAAEMRRKMAGG